VRRAAFAGLALCMVFSASMAAAADAESTASDPQLEARVQRVSEELRCLVCQNQTIADSNAELAQDLRREVRQMLGRGASESEVREFMVTRYGDFILYRPPFKATTLALWVGPFVLLVAGFWIHRRTVAAKRSAIESTRLSSADEVRLQSLVGMPQDAERR
jgi:cytochrome c-type biogenesis protein CcmH